MLWPSDQAINATGERKGSLIVFVFLSATPKTPFLSTQIVLALEGGYDLPAICDSAQECVKALLGDDIAPISDVELRRAPCSSAVETLQKTIAIQMNHWPCVKQLAHTVMLSTLEALTSERDESETVNAMAGLSMQPPNR